MTRSLNVRKGKLHYLEEIYCWSASHTREERKRTLRDSSHLYAFVMKIFLLTAIPEESSNITGKHSAFEILEDISANHLDVNEIGNDIESSNTTLPSEHRKSAYYTTTFPDRLRAPVGNTNNASTPHSLTHSA